MLFSIWYLFFKPPWETGIAPPILEALVADESITPGRAIDLGCGTGTNALFLAKHGWEVQGIDFAAPAIRTAQRKRSKAPADVAARVEFRTGDVSKLEDTEPPSPGSSGPGGAFHDAVCTPRPSASGTG